MNIAVIDCNAIGYMAHYSTSQMNRSDGTPVGIIWGFFNQLKTVCDRHIPPKLAALTKHHADFAHMVDPVFPRRASVDDALTAVGREDTAHDLDGATFSRTVRADITHHLPVPNRERDVI